MAPDLPGRCVLVVDDEATIREVVGRYLTAAGFAVVEAADGPAALRAAQTRRIDLVVLDLLLPGMSGLECCRRLRAAGPVPILMLTASGEEADKLRGFALGADDYVTKPFSPREIVMRVQAILRRGLASGAPPATIVGDGFTIIPERRVVEARGAPVELTAKEFDLLHFLCRHPRQVFTRQQLLDHVWGLDFFGDASTVTVHMRRLREKIERDPANPRHLKTVWSVGYKYEPALNPPDAPAPAEPRGATREPAGAERWETER